MSLTKDDSIEAIAYLEHILGGGYQTSPDSTALQQLDFLEFVEQIGLDTKGGIFHLLFIAEMKG